MRTGMNRFKMVRGTIFYTVLLNATIHAIPSFAAAYEWETGAFSNPAYFATVKKLKVEITGTTVQKDDTFTGTVVSGGSTFGPGTANSHTYTVYPTGRIGIRLTPSLVMGLRFTRPYGENIKYIDTSIIAPINSQIKLDVYDIEPDVAYSITPKFTVGAGLDIYQVRTATLANMAVSSGAVFTSKFDSRDGMGWHAGLLYRIFTPTVFDVFYYAPASVNLDGTSSLGGTIVSKTLKANLKFPARMRFTLTQYLKEEWYVFGSAIYTRWGSIQRIILVNNLGSGANSTINLDYRDIWSFILGTSYDINSKWTAYTGAKYEPNFVDWSKGKTTNLGYESYSAFLGGTYAINKEFKADFGVSRIFPHIQKNSGVDALTGATVNGHTRAYTNAVWLGFIYGA